MQSWPCQLTTVVKQQSIAQSPPMPIRKRRMLLCHEERWAVARSVSLPPGLQGTRHKALSEQCRRTEHDSSASAVLLRSAERGLAWQQGRGDFDDSFQSCDATRAAVSTGSITTLETVIMTCLRACRGAVHLNLDERHRARPSYSVRGPGCCAGSAIFQRRRVGIGKKSHVRVLGGP